MSAQHLEVSPGPTERTVTTAAGEVLAVPDDWVLVPPGDAGLTRRIKAAGPTWTVKVKRGRRSFSQGLWACAATVGEVTRQLEIERQDPSYQRKLEAGRKRRAAQQAVYADEFQRAVESFLAFSPPHETLGRAVAAAIAEHAVPVGSGTVARTQRIPIERRAESATIAWLRHQTTEYDDMHIPRIKGMRREVRRLLAQRSRALLQVYRQGGAVDPSRCPLRRALSPFE